MKKQLPVKTYENQKRNIKHEELRKPKLRIIFWFSQKTSFNLGNIIFRKYFATTSKFYTSEQI